MGTLFVEIALVICLAAIFAFLFRLLKQPPLLAYLLSGIFIGPFAKLNLANVEALRTFGELGITLLLFTVGLELRVSELRSIGKAALIIGVLQMVVTAIASYLVSIALGFPQLVAAYVSLALTFSSTIVVVKLLSDKRDLSSLYGKITVGVLLVQDFFAILALVFLSDIATLSQTLNPLPALVFVLIKVVALFTVVLLASKLLLPYIIDRVARSSETLFLTSIAWVVGVSAIVGSSLLGFSIEIGGLLAGLALANSDENLQIVSLMRPLRDFFLTIFFVFLGMNLRLSNIGGVFFPAVVLSLFVLVGKPIIMLAIMGVMGYRKRTSFFSAAAVAQVSEFSLILLFFGSRLGHLTQETVSLMLLVAVVSFALSPYLILNSNTLHRVLGRYLAVLERKEKGEKKEGISAQDLSRLSHHVVLVGVNRAGTSILEVLQAKKEKVVVVDFDPNVIKKLSGKAVAYLFGDIADTDIQERVGLSRAKLVISTVVDVQDNLLLLAGLQRQKSRAKVVVMGENREDAKLLQKQGADYVALPHVASGQHIAHLIQEGAFNPARGGVNHKK